MMKSVCLGLVMVLLLVQLNARHHHMHHRHHSHHEHHHHHEHHDHGHDQSLAQTQLSFLESNPFFKGFWKNITKNPSDTAFNKACEALNQVKGASHLLDFNSRLARVHESWDITKFAPHWNKWGHGKKYWSTNVGELAHKSLKDLFKLVEEHWSVVFLPYMKRKNLHDKFLGIKRCNRRIHLAKLPAFDHIFGADWAKNFKGHTKRFEHFSGHYLAKIMRKMIENQGKTFCAKPADDKKAAILKKKAEIEANKAKIKKDKEDILKKEAENKKKEAEIKNVKQDIKKDEKRKAEVKKTENKLKAAEKALEAKKNDLVAKKKELEKKGAHGHKAGHKSGDKKAPHVHTKPGAAVGSGAAGPPPKKDVKKF